MPGRCACCVARLGIYEFTYSHMKNTNQYPGENSYAECCGFSLSNGQSKACTDKLIAYCSNYHTRDFLSSRLSPRDCTVSFITRPPAATKTDCKKPYPIVQLRHICLQSQEEGQRAKIRAGETFRSVSIPQAHLAAVVADRESDAKGKVV